ncbi:MAG: gamma-glutamyltransferase [candidate division Zixibacteria bacterium]|nr:gamma-glutamyltransferase [candidate division Zixibacteria bacterium]
MQTTIKLLITFVSTALLTSQAFTASPKPAAANNGMVVASEKIAAEIGLEQLKSGGNAIDAAIATAAALNVTEGYSSGMGGGCFVLVYWAETDEVYVIDGRERAPLKADRDLYVDKNTGEVIGGLSTTGVTAAGTPGQPAALEKIHKRWGSSPWAELFAPAIALADTGFDISRTYALRLLYTREKLIQFPSSREVFFPPGDTLPYGFGDRLIQNDLAGFLQNLSDKGVDWFYNSDFADKLVDFVKQNNGYLQENDMQSYEAVERQPIHGNFRGYDIYSMPPPSSGGIHVVQILEMLEPFNLSYWGAGSSETIHLLAETMKRAFADRSFYLGDPDHVDVPIAGLLDQDYLDRQRSTMKPYQASTIQGHGKLPGSESSQTTHFSIIDKDGNMVAMTSTINTSFGSAVVVPGWGLLLNNQMDDFSTQPGVPNYYGLVGSEANAIDAGKRPLSSMSPTIVLKDGKPTGILGSPGGPRIITTVLQTFLNIVEFGMDVQEAVDFPRVHHQWKPDVIFIEQGIPVDVLANLMAKGHEVYQTGTWSSAQCIWVDQDSGLITGGTDSRSEGKAAGY